MPKKHAPAYNHTKPSYVHPSLQSSSSPSAPSAPAPSAPAPSAPASSASASSAPASEPQTVNQRIQQLRRAQTPRPTQEQRDRLTTSPSRSVTPELRRILHIPEVNAPQPKANSRTRTVAGAARPPPGPAEPGSWLLKSRHAPAYAPSTRTREGGAASEARFGALARVNQRLPPPRSLVHQCLRTFALHWQALAEYEQHYMAALPVPLKEALLSYLAVYGERGCMDSRSFKILFQNEQGVGTAAWHETRCLDLTNLLSARLGVGDVGRCLKRSAAHAMPDITALDIRDTTANAIPPVDIVESWDQEMDDATPPPPPQPILTAKLQTPHFTNLSRLSLAHPGHTASWPDLIRVAPHLNKLTHLSIAYWPRPSLTPHANTTSMISGHTSVSLGGSHLYSDLDDDWHEATNILRRFSIATYSLHWLDLEGCTWLQALTWRGEASMHAPHRAGDALQDTWDVSSALPGPDWNDAWRRITYLNVFQGWIPSNTQSLQNMPAGVVPVQVMRWLREHGEEEHVRWKLNARETGHAVAEWVSREKSARSVGAEIQRARKKGKGEGVWCRVDYGWGGDGVGDKVS